MKVLGNLFAGMGIGLLGGLIIGLVIFIWPLFGCIADCSCGLGGLACGIAQCSLVFCESSYYSKGKDTIDDSCARCDKSYETCNEGDFVDTDFSKPAYVYSIIFTTGIGAWIGSLCGVGATVMKLKGKGEKP